MIIERRKTAETGATLGDAPAMNRPYPCLAAHTRRRIAAPGWPGWPWVWRRQAAGFN